MEVPTSATGRPWVVRVNTDGCAVDDLSFCGGVQVSVRGDAPWDDFVEWAVSTEWVGVEALSGLPGTVAEAVATNASAFGQAVADTVASVRTWDVEVDAQRTFAAAECGFGPGTSRFAEAAGRFEIRAVSFLMRQGDLSAPVTDPELAALVDIPIGSRASLTTIRSAVLRA